MRLGHPASGAPVVGSWFGFGELPVRGSTTTVRKSAHAVTAAGHSTTFGACARFVADLSDPDASLFVLLGGQDGWFGSVNFLDQVDPFLEGGAIEVPLTEAAVRAAFERAVLLEPGVAGM